MNETIGVKGGANDRRRVLFISKKRLKKLKKYQEQIEKKKLKSLEKKVKRLQIMSFIKVVPIVIPIQAIMTILKNSSKQSGESKSNKKQNNTITLINKSKNKRRNQIVINNKHNIEIITANTTKNSKKEEVKCQDNKYMHSNKNNKDKKPHNKKLEKDFLKDYVKNKNNMDTSTKIISNKIIGYYEDKFKETRTEIKKLMSEYDELSKKRLNNYPIDELENLKKDLNKIIDKLNYLRKKIYAEDIPNEYFYNFIDEYLEKIKNKEDIDFLDDSKLYIMISEKLDLIDEIIEEKKKDLNQIKENEEFLELENKNDDSYSEKVEMLDISDSENIDYFKYSKFSESLDNFQKEQSKILVKVEHELTDTKDKSKKIILKIKALNLESMLLFSIILGTMLARPSIRNAKAMAISTLVGVYSMNNIMKDRSDSKKEKTIKEEDFAREIESNIESIDDVISLVGKTKEELDKLIYNIKENLNDYKELYEYQNLIANLESIKSEILEKEYEILKIKEQQQAIKNSKVKVRKLDES